MKRLIEKGLMFANLVHVASPALVERYNRALEHLTGKRTTLSDFYIDISGYSPEIGHELGDPLYLNHAGVNRQFILLTIDQKRAPLLETKFSTCHTILRQFIEQNEAELFALTARDAVAGELVNTVLTVSSPAKLFDIRRITVEADTTRGTVKQGKVLGQKIDQFMSKDEAWYDDVLIAEMIQLAAKTGDVTRNPIQLKDMSFEIGNFWTAHFGGLYVFQDVDHPAMIAVAQDKSKLDVPIAHVFTPKDRHQIAKFFDLNGLVEPIVKARGIDAGAILRQKMDFILVDALSQKLGDSNSTDHRALRRLARKYVHLLPPEYHTLGDLLRWAEDGGRWPKITSSDPAYFYTLRSADHPDRDLVNMLLAELAPKDMRQVFICHKDLFYRAYAGWPEAKRNYVATYLERDYLRDKAGMRAELFGHEGPEVEPQLIERVGPWGAVRR